MLHDPDVKKSNFSLLFFMHTMFYIFYILKSNSNL